MRNFQLEVEAQRPYLLRFASLQLRDGHAAEDAVQETLVAALAAEGSFAGRSNLRTWLTGILKHKIIDAIRRPDRRPRARWRSVPTKISMPCSTRPAIGPR